MPIRPENMAKYPGGSIRSPEWLAIRERIRARAGNCCEECGVENHALGGRDEDGHWFYAQDDDVVPGEYGFCTDLTGQRGERDLRIIKIVCTVAHVDGKLNDHSDENLRFWCQRCHNRHDAASRRANAAITIHDRRNGTLDLFRGDQ